MLQTDDAIPQMIHPSAQTENRWEKTAVCEPNAAPKKHLFVPQTQVVLGNFDRQISIGKHGHLSSATIACLRSWPFQNYAEVKHLSRRAAIWGSRLGTENLNSR